ncbi:MAG: DUF4167 domain-containing protein [Novosphingobium sp.]
MPELNNNRGNNRRRGRSNNRSQSGGQQLNRIDSRARGNAPQMLEKYRKLAQDAHMNGDRVQAEYYLQFADHYFRVIADTRLRQEEQRSRQNGGQGGGDRWQEQDIEDDGGDFSVEGDFPAFDRPVSTRREREERENRPERAEPGERSERREREERPRDERGRDERGDGRRRFERNRGRDDEAVAAPQEPLPGEGIPAIEGEPVIAAEDNPFVRDNRAARGLRPRGERRTRKAAADGEAAGGEAAGGEVPADEAPATLDASFLPPSISARAEPEAEDEAAEAPAAAPKKRGRPRKTPVPEASEPAEG